MAGYSTYLERRTTETGGAQEGERTLLNISDRFRGDGQGGGLSAEVLRLLSVEFSRANKEHT